jgi:hypothetical protein
MLPVAASAQALLPPFEVATSVRSMGLQPVSRPALHGTRYVFRAVDRRGTEVKVSADAFSGRVLFVEPLGHGGEGVIAGRDYPPVFPQETVPPRAGNNRPGSYDPRVGYQRQVPVNPGEPSVIYAPRGNEGAQSNNPQRSGQAPSAAKPVPRVAAKPPVKPAAPEAAVEASPPSEPPTGSTDGANAAVPPAPAVEKNPALTAPPVQAFD